MFGPPKASPQPNWTRICYRVLWKTLHYQVFGALYHAMHARAVNPTAFSAVSTQLISCVDVRCYRIEFILVERV